VHALDELALAGTALSLMLSFWLLRKNWCRALQFAAFLMAVTSLNLGSPFWTEAYVLATSFRRYSWY